MRAAWQQPILEWKYLLFNWNDHPEHIAQAIEMAKAIGVDIISFWPTSNPFYGISWRYRLGQFNHVGEAMLEGPRNRFRGNQSGRRGSKGKQAENCPKQFWRDAVQHSAIKRNQHNL